MTWFLKSTVKWVVKIVLTSLNFCPEAQFRQGLSSIWLDVESLPDAPPRICANSGPN
jgi:hypothetical protein